MSLHQTQGGSRIVDGQDGQDGKFEDWMDMLNSRPDELQKGLPAEQVVFEATFRNVEADGSTWMYHLTLCGENTGGLDETIPIDAEHGAYSRSVKEPGWQELEPTFMLTPQSPPGSDAALGRNRTSLT